jgi:thiol-disulfide isomerase/thioredoxin
MRAITLGALLILAGTAIGLAPEPKAPAAPPANAKAEPMKPDWERPTVFVGSDAPSLGELEFVAGQPIASFEPGKVYVVEFFATWDGPSRDNFRHLTRLQSELKSQGLEVLAICGREDPGTDVKSFVERMGERIGYRVAVDRAGATDKSWMYASQRFSLPCTFVVDRQGKIAWIGAPRSGLVSVVRDVVAGTFNPEARAKLDQQFAELERDYADSRRAKDFDRAHELLNEAAKLAPEAKSIIELTRFEMMLIDQQQTMDAYKLANKLIASELRDEERLLRRMAGMIAEGKNVKRRDWDLALACCQRAVELTGDRDGWALASLAEVQFLRGEIDSAIETQVKAAALATGDQQLSPKVRDALEKYRAVQAQQNSGGVSTVPTDR